MRGRDRQLFAILQRGNTKWVRVPQGSLKPGEEWKLLGASAVSLSTYRILLIKYKDALVLTLDERGTTDPKRPNWTTMFTWHSSNPEDREVLLKIFQVARNGAFHFPLFSI